MVRFRVVLNRIFPWNSPGIELGLGKHLPLPHGNSSFSFCSSFRGQLLVNMREEVPFLDKNIPFDLN